MSNTVQDHFWKFYKQPVVYLYSAAVAPEIWKLRASKIKTSFGRTDPEKESLAAPDQALLSLWQSLSMLLYLSLEYF